MSLCIENLAIGAGTGGSGGSPPAILLPETKFTQMSLGVLRGDDILIRSEGIDRKFHPTDIDTNNGTITISSFEDGAVVLLQDLGKKLSKTSTSLSLMQKMKSKAVTTDGILMKSITDIITIPAVITEDHESLLGTGGGGGSPPSENEDQGGIRKRWITPE